MAKLSAHLLRCCRPLAVLLAAVWLAGRPPASAATASPEQVIAGWPAISAHPLVGRIWLARDGRVLDAIAIIRDLETSAAIGSALGLTGSSGPTHVLLGEVHDNPEHHRLRAGLIDDITGRTRFGRTEHPAVVTEHIRTEQAPQLQAFRDLGLASDDPGAVDDLLRLLQWERSGWPAARMFRPLYEIVIAARLPLRPGDVARERIRAVARGGPAALEPGERDRLGLAMALPGPLEAALAGELKASHCGVLPDSAIPGMALAQRYRDAHLAEALIEVLPLTGRTVLLAGNGHVRTDRGVPWHLRQRTPQSTAFAVMLLEVEDGTTEVAAYVPRDPDGRPAADAVVLTPRAEREDPCAGMRAAGPRKG